MVAPTHPYVKVIDYLSTDPSACSPLLGFIELSEDVRVKDRDWTVTVFDVIQKPTDARVKLLYRFLVEGVDKPAKVLQRTVEVESFNLHDQRQYGTTPAYPAVIYAFSPIDSELARSIPMLMQLPRVQTISLIFGTRASKGNPPKVFI
jgi:hypothetical protein